MTDAITSNTIISHELQLDQQLNHAVLRADRDHFRLLLSSLSSDVEDHSQFHLSADSGVDAASEQTPWLRRKFQLGAEQALVADRDLSQQSLVEGKTFHDQGLVQLKLKQALVPPPLLGEQLKSIPSQVMAQMPPWKRSKLEQPTPRADQQADKPERLLNLIHKAVAVPDELKVEFHHQARA